MAHPQPQTPQGESVAKKVHCYSSIFLLQWCQNECDGISNHRHRTICSGADQIKHQSSASLAFVRGIHQWLVNSPHKGPVKQKIFRPMMSSCFQFQSIPSIPKNESEDKTYSNIVNTILFYTSYYSFQIKMIWLKLIFTKPVSYSYHNILGSEDMS